MSRKLPNAIIQSGVSFLEKKRIKEKDILCQRKDCVRLANLMEEVNTLTKEDRYMELEFSTI